MSQKERCARPTSQKPTLTLAKKSALAESSGRSIASAHQPPARLPQRPRSIVAQREGAMHTAARRAFPRFFRDRCACGM